MVQEVAAETDPTFVAARVEYYRLTEALNKLMALQAKVAVSMTQGQNQLMMGTMQEMQKNPGLSMDEKAAKMTEIFFKVVGTMSPAQAGNFYNFRQSMFDLGITEFLDAGLTSAAEAAMNAAGNPDAADVGWGSWLISGAVAGALLGEDDEPEAQPVPVAVQDAARAGSLVLDGSRTLLFEIAAFGAKSAAVSRIVRGVCGGGETHSC